MNQSAGRAKSSRSQAGGRSRAGGSPRQGHGSPGHQAGPSILLERGSGRGRSLTSVGPVGRRCQLTQSGAISGTPLLYVSEQALGWKVDQRPISSAWGSVLGTGCVMPEGPPVALAGRCRRAETGRRRRSRVPSGRLFPKSPNGWRRSPNSTPRTPTVAASLLARSFTGSTRGPQPIGLGSSRNQPRPNAAGVIEETASPATAGLPR